MKTAIASPDGPDKKKFGIPKKDKKGLAKKTEYEYKSETLGNKKKPKPKSKDDAKPTRYDEGKPMKGDPSKFSKHESWMNKPKPKDTDKQTPKPKDKDGQNIRRSREEKNPHKPMDYTKGEVPKTPKKDSGDKRRQGTKDLQFEKSYKVVPNKLKTKEDLNKKDTPSTKKGKK